MDDYNQYVTAINKIFDYISKMRAGWSNIDNSNYLDTLEEFKNAVTTNAEAFKKAPDPNLMVTEEASDESQQVQPEQPQTEEKAQKLEQTPPIPEQKVEQPQQPVTVQSAPATNAEQVASPVPSLNTGQVEQQVKQPQQQVPSPVPQLNQAPVNQQPVEIPPAPSPLPTITPPAQ